MNPETNEIPQLNPGGQRDVIGDKVAELIGRTWTMEPGGEKASNTPPIPADEPDQSAHKKILGKLKRTGTPKSKDSRIYPPGS